MKNGKIKVGVIGVHPGQGWATTAHIPALQASSDYELVALMNSNGQLARQAADKFKVPNAFESHLDLLKLPDLDLVVVTVKVPNHFELVSAALKAGKAVYSEWPLGRNVAEAIELAKLAKNQQVRGAVGLQSRSCACRQLRQRPDQRGLRRRSAFDFARRVGHFVGGDAPSHVYLHAGPQEWGEHDQPRLWARPRFRFLRARFTNKGTHGDPRESATFGEDCRD